jgi:hypothetical protein
MLNPQLSHPRPHHYKTLASMRSPSLKEIAGDIYNDEEREHFMEENSIENRSGQIWTATS